MIKYTPKMLNRFLRNLSTERGIHWLVPASQLEASGHNSVKLHRLCELYDQSGSLFLDMYMQLCDDRSGPEYLLIRFYSAFLDEICDYQRTNFNRTMSLTGDGTISGYRALFLRYVWEEQQRLLNAILRSWNSTQP